MREDIKKRIEQVQSGVVPSGYIKTKQGVLPQCWKQYKMRDIFSKVGKPVIVDLEKEYVQIGIRSHCKGLFRKASVTGKELGNKAVFWIEPDCFVVNIVFAWEQAIGKTTKEDVGCIGSHRFPMYRPLEDKVDLDYILHFFMTKRGKDTLEEASPGGAGRNKTLGQDRFAKSSIIFPSFSEQQKIAEILNHCDKVIDLKQQLIEEEHNRKRWLMRYLFVPDSGVRLRGFVGEWIEFKLGENGTTYGGLSGKSEEDFGSGKPYIPYLNIYLNSVVDENNFDYVEISEDEKQNRVKHGDIFFTTSSETPDEVGMSAVYLGGSTELYLNSFSFGYRLKSYDKLIPEFAAYFFESTNMKRLLYRLAQGATRYNLSKSELMKQTVLIPPTIQEQIAISNTITNVGLRIALLEQELAQCKQRKKALMQLLLSGLARVKA